MGAGDMGLEREFAGGGPPGAPRGSRTVQVAVRHREMLGYGDGAHPFPGPERGRHPGAFVTRMFRTRLIVSLAVGILLGTSAWNCARAGEKPRTRVLLIGVDAGEWDVLGPLLD